MSSRISTSLDTGRLAEAVARPGIDPRCWVSLAVIEDIAIDPDEGIFADVYTMPGRERLTARVMSPYIREQAGIFFPLKVGDEVVIGWPSGDSMLGICVLGRVFSPACKPSLEFAKDPAAVNVNIPETLDTTNDVVLVVEEGQSVRIKVSGPNSTNQLTFNGDEFKIETSGNAKVYLGGDSSTTQPFALGEELENYMGSSASVVPGTGGLLGFLQRMAVFVGFPTIADPVPSFPASVKATKVEGQ